MALTKFRHMPEMRQKLGRNTPRYNKLNDLKLYIIYSYYKQYIHITYTHTHKNLLYQLFAQVKKCTQLAIVCACMCFQESGMRYVSNVSRCENVVKLPWQLQLLLPLHLHRHRVPLCELCVKHWTSY